MPEVQRKDLLRRIARTKAKIALNPYIPYTPHPKQLVGHFLYDVPEIFFGGAAGGGKSDWLLAEGLTDVDLHPVGGIILRESFPLLSHEPDGLIPRSHKWLGPTDAHWNGINKTWRFPSGATLAFGHLLNERDHLKYAGPSYHFVGFDEVTEIRGRQYRYLGFGRSRKVVDPRLRTIRLRVRATGNPGGRSHQFFKQRFNLPEGPPPEHRGRRVYLPSKISDNPSLEQESYIANLMELDPVDRERLLKGDWTIRESGMLFDAGWFRVVEGYELPDQMTKFVRSWDMAATDESDGDDPDWTVGVLMGELDGQFWILDVVRFRASSKTIDDTIRETARLDGRDVQIRFEQEPGSSGKNLIGTYRRTILKGYTVHGQPSTGSKVARARPISSAAEAGNVFILRGLWNEDFLEEVTLFPRKDVHDDQVDALAGAHHHLTDPDRNRNWDAH